MCLQNSANEAGLLCSIIALPSHDKLISALAVITFVNGGATKEHKVSHGINFKAAKALSKSMAVVAPPRRAFGAGDNPATAQCATSCDRHMKEADEREFPWLKDSTNSEDYYTTVVYDTSSMEALCG